MGDRIIEPAREEISFLPTPLEKSELDFLNFLDDRLPSEWEIYIQPPFNGLRPDFVILHPLNGIGIYEIKDWSPETEFKIRNNALYQKETSTGRFFRNSSQPIHQIRSYRDEIMDLFCPNIEKKHFSTIFCGLVFPRWQSQKINQLFDEEYLTKNRYNGNKYRNNLLIGEDDLSSEKIENVMPNAYTRHNLMSEDLCRDIRSWVSESVLDQEQRHSPRLSPEQINIVTTRTRSGYRRVRGAAGSGKTICLAGRAQNLAQNDKRVLVLSYNKTLTNEIRDMAMRFGREAKRVEFRHYHDWAKRICLKNAFDERWNELFLGKTSEEIDGALRSGVPRLINEVLNSIELDGQLPDEALWDAILLDEGQDFEPSWWGNLRRVIRPGGEALLVSDVTQDLYGTAQHWTEDTMKGAGFSGQWGELKTVYRLPLKIHQLVNDFAEKFLPDNQERILAEPNQASLNLEPVFFHWITISQTSNPADIVTKSITRLKQKVDSLPGFKPLPYSDITFLVPNEKLGREISDILNSKNFNVSDTFSIKGDDRKSNLKKLYFFKGSGRIKGATFQSYKGLENRAIVAYLPEPQDAKDIQAFYVALTRLKASSKGSCLVVISPWKAAVSFGEKWTQKLSFNDVLGPQGDETKSRDSANNKNKPSTEDSPKVGKASFKEGQRGVSYEGLFGEYLIGSNQVTIVDPYIKAAHQFNNLSDFLRTVGKVCGRRNRVKVTLKTLPTKLDDKISSHDREQIFKNYQSSFSSHGIDFSWIYQDGLHGRIITTDTGWEILLDRGLDIFRPSSSGSSDQKLREVRGFYISYHKMEERPQA